MSEHADVGETATAEMTPRPRRTSRRFQILILVVLAVALGWSGLWFFAKHYVERRIGTAKADIEANGGELTCDGERVRGFPFRLTVDCAPLVVDLPDGLSATLPGLEAITLLYNPGHSLAAAKGPLAFKGPDGLAVDTDWGMLESSLRVGFSSLKRFSAITRDFSAKMTGTAANLPEAAKLRNGQIHLLAAQGDPTGLEVWATADGLVLTLPSRPDLPEAVIQAHAVLPGALPTRRNGRIDMLSGWLQAGGKVHLDTLAIDMGGFSAMTMGDLSVGDDGKISGSLTIRADQLERLPDLAEALKPGSHDEVAKIVVPLSTLMRPVTVDGRSWRQTTITIRDGRASVGFIPLGKIPRLHLPQTEG